MALPKARISRKLRARITHRPLATAPESPLTVLRFLALLVIAAFAALHYENLCIILR